MCEPPRNLEKMCGPPRNPRKKCAGHLETEKKMCGPPPEILEKTSQSEPHPRDRRKSWKKPHNLPELLVVVVGWLLVDKLCRGPLRGQKSLNYFEKKSMLEAIDALLSSEKSET